MLIYTQKVPDRNNDLSTSENIRKTVDCQIYLQKRVRGQKETNKLAFPVGLTAKIKTKTISSLKLGNLSLLEEHSMHKSLWIGSKTLSKIFKSKLNIITNVNSRF
jgi:hypothetical protein